MRISTPDPPSVPRRSTRRRWWAPLLALPLAAVLAALPAAAQVPFVSEEPPPGPCAEGARLFREQDYEGARPQLLACLESEGERADILVALAVIGFQTGDVDEARRYGERAVAYDPDNADARYWYGRALLRSGEIVAAESQWDAGLRLATDHVGLLEGLAKLALDRGETEKAYGLLSQLRLQGVDDAWVHRLLADLARRKGLWRQSLLHWDEALKRGLPSTEDLLVASELSILADLPQEAVAYARRAVALEPSGLTYGGLGQALFAADLPDSAVQPLRRAVELEPDNPRHRFQLGNVLEVLGRVEEAEEEFAAYVAMAPQDPIGHLNYGVHLEGQGRQLEALEQVTLAADLDSQLLRSRVLQAQILEELGRYEEALAVVDDLADDAADGARYERWQERLRIDLRAAEASQGAGKIRLLHIMIADSTEVEVVVAALAAGADFASLAARFSVGSTAVAGGDIGWVAPAEMVEPMRSAIADLEPQQISPPIASQGYVHFFKRVY